MVTRQKARVPYTPAEQSLLDRWPDLAMLHRSDWSRAAAHLDEADAARREGRPCSWCPVERTGPPGWS